MTQFIPVSSLSTLSPQTIKGYDVDGVVDGRPVRVRYNRFGGVVPAIGATLLTSYGRGVVTGYSEGSLRVAISEFNEDFAYELPDGSDILTAEEQVASLSRCANAGIDSLISDIVRLYKSEITEKLPKSWQQKVDAIERFDDNEFIMDLTDKSNLEKQLIDGFLLVDVVAIERETKAERKRRKALELAEARRLRRELLDAYDAQCPDDIAAEIAEQFGETDDLDGQEGEF
jgi:hypothetical protein